MGYGKKQMQDLEETINRSDCDVVVIGTPIDLRRVIKINKPATRVKYYLKELSTPTIADILKEKGII
jgi:predicted GTPase